MGRPGIEKQKQSLKGVGVLADLSNEELGLVAAIARRVQVGAGSVIMREGEVGDSMYLFAEGEVAVTKNLTLKAGHGGFSKAEKSMVRLNAQYVSFFGDMAMFEQDVRSATITASTDCLLYEVHRDGFERLCADHPALGYKLIRRIAAVLCSRIRQGNQDILKLTTALSIALSR
jgi:CRP-like cAMP-binding protein